MEGNYRRAGKVVKERTGAAVSGRGCRAAGYPGDGLGSDTPAAESRVSGVCSRVCRQNRLPDSYNPKEPRRERASAQSLFRKCVSICDVSHRHFGGWQFASRQLKPGLMSGISDKAECRAGL